MALPNNFVKIRISRGMCVGRKERQENESASLYFSLVYITSLFMAIEKKIAKLKTRENKSS